VSPSLLIERLGNGVVVLRLNRPDRLNALTSELVDELFGQFLALADDDRTRVIILTGAGRAFCAGMDLKDSGFSIPDDGPAPEQRLRVQERMGALIVSLRRLRQPVIAAVNGAAVGGGLALALGADIRVCGEAARFGAAFVRIGLSGCDMGVSYHLPRVVGMSHAASWMLTGRLVGADEALRSGLVSEVVPDETVVDRAIQVAGEIVANAPFGVRMTKRVMWANVDAPSIEAAVELENRTQILTSFSADKAEAERAFLEKRPAQFGNR
jgi:enoyl-CoA hydratase